MRSKTGLQDTVTGTVHRLLQVSLLVLLDLLAILVSFLIAFEIRAYLGGITPLFDPPRPDLGLFIQNWPIVILWPLILWREGLYPGLWITPDEELRRLLEGTTIASLVVIALTFVTQTGQTFSRPILLGWWLASLVMLPLNHFGAKFLLSLLGMKGPPIVIIGVNDLSSRILQGLTLQNLPSFSPVMVLTDDPVKQGGELLGVPVQGPIQSANELAESSDIDTVMIVLPEVSGKRLVGLAEQMSKSFRRVLIVPDLYGLSTVQTGVRDLEGLLALEVRTNLLSAGSQIIKRVLELAITLFATILLLPVLLAIMAALWLERQGPIFYGHRRIGKAGQEFTAWKFRTMVQEADRVLQEALTKEPSLRHEWNQNQKLKRDPRLTSVGRLLRRFSLDELPQLWNVWKREMSLVGPRPIIEGETEKYGGAISLYYQVRPGITGLWQVSGRSDLTYQERIRLDSYYVRNWSVWLDLVILLRTLLAVLSGRGAY